MNSDRNGRRITVGIVVDLRTINEVRLAWPTWRKYRHEMWEWPWVFAYDVNEGLSYDTLLDLADEMGIPPGATYYAWPLAGATYATQREKMLAAWVHAIPNVVRTKYWLKLDAHTIAVSRPAGDWVPWDELTDSVPFAAPKWRYTKGPQMLIWLEEWANKTWPLSQFPPLNLVPPDRAAWARVPHQRHWTPMAYLNTQWTQLVSDICARSCGKGHIPAPSQDTLLSYVAQRTRYPAVAVPLKKVGWRHCPFTLEKAVLHAMGDESWNSS